MIKPTYSTPSHLRTYNLSQLDQLVAHRYVPLILFYLNNENCSVIDDDKAREIKKSLSQSLIHHYHFAGMLATPTTPFIDCNDEGVLFIEAQHDSQLDKFQHISEQNETMVQLFVDDMAWFTSRGSCTVLVGVQFNHFACGRLAVAISMSHFIGDALDVRRKLVPKLPQTTASKIRKEKEQLERVQSIKQATKNYKSALSVLERKVVSRRAYCVSSFYGFPLYKADFGWGNPAGATIYLKNTGYTFIVLMDTLDEDGIEALVSLVKEDMEILKKDKEMLSFAK
ncbi:putative transferase, chloramphenicol acetyltransferase-like domain protein [Tanacetum coccineum]